jgi:hypothetical protein
MVFAVVMLAVITPPFLASLFVALAVAQCARPITINDLNLLGHDEAS